MFVRLGNTPLRYAWGARGAISAYLGDAGAVIEPESDGAEPPIQAELWLGAHYGSPSRILEPERTGGATDLRAWIASDPATTLDALAGGLREGDGARLPFLFKVLAAGQALSLQVHPTLERARRGFAAENAAGLPLDAPERNYRDPFHKPELLVALSDTMRALAGFRSAAQVRALVAEVGRAALEAGHGAGFSAFADRVAAITGEQDCRELVGWILSCGDEAAAALPGVDAWIATPATGFARERENIARIREAFPDDAGVLTALLLNHLTLRRGDAAYIRAGVIHAYLEGVGLELMAASDNVLRGGLTPKHVDVGELLDVLVCAPTPAPYLGAEILADGVITYEPDEPDFRLQRLDARDADATVHVPGPGIALCLRGTATLTGASGETCVLAHGESVYVTPDERDVRIVGDDIDVVIASVGLDPEDAVPLA